MGWLIRSGFRRKLLEVLFDGKAEADALLAHGAFVRAAEFKGFCVDFVHHVFGIDGQRDHHAVADRGDRPVVGNAVLIDAHDSRPRADGLRHGAALSDLPRL